ncbi:MAG TPA: TQO small subunit DoxD [Ktedonobacteraceae bacterium]
MIKLEVKNAALPKLKATQAELETSQAELEATQADLEASQTKLEASQAELEATQAELEASQIELETSQIELEASQEQVVQLRERLQELKRQQVKDTYDGSNLSPGRNTTRFPGWILLPMRVFLGLTFIYAGIQKLTDPQFFDPTMPGYIASQIRGMAHGSPLHDFLLSVALPHAVLFGWMTALGEIAVGLGTYAGFLFRPAAFFGMLLSLTFFLSASWNTYPYFFGSDIVFVFCWITMILGGPINTGLASIDDWLVDQLVARDNTLQKLPIVLQLYIFLVVAGSPQKSSYTAKISLLQTNPITGNLLQAYQHKPSEVQNEQMTRRIMLQDWAKGAATVASITLLGIPLRIFGNDPNENLATTTTSTTSTTSIPETSTPDTVSTPDTTSTPNTANTPDTANTPSTTQTPTKTSTPITKTPPIPVRPVSVGQTIAPVSAVAQNSSVPFIIASSQDSATLIRLPSDNFVAYDTICPHAGYTVLYQPDTHIFKCPGHGSEFDPTTGAVIQGPATTGLSKLGIQIDNSTGAIKLTSVPS